MQLLKICFSILILLLTVPVYAQQTFTHDSADVYLRALNNEVTDFWGPIKGQATKPLYEHADRYVLRALVNLLKDSSRVVAAHFLLTRLLEPHKGKFYHTTEDFTDSLLVIASYNGFNWKNMQDKYTLTGDIRVDSAEMTRIEEYWRQQPKLREKLK